MYNPDQPQGPLSWRQKICHVWVGGWGDLAAACCLSRGNVIRKIRKHTRPYRTSQPYSNRISRFRSSASILLYLPPVPIRGVADQKSALHQPCKHRAAYMLPGALSFFPFVLHDSRDDLGLPSRPPRAALPQLFGRAEDLQLSGSSDLARKEREHVTRADCISGPETGGSAIAQS
jgi:hypothetical protein